MDRQIKMTQHTGQTQAFLADNETLTQDSTLANPTYKDYTLSIFGLDCPSCASRIEDSLNALPQVSKANVDFSTNTLYLSTSDLSLAKSTIYAIEPQARLTLPQDSISIDSTQDSTQTPQSQKGFVFLESVFIFTLIGIFGLCMGVLHLTTFGEQNAPYIYGILAFLYLIAGKPIFLNTLNNLKNKVIFDENFLMLFATIAAFCLGEISEAVAVMLFFRLGEFLESRAVQKSKDSIKALLQVIPTIAHKKTTNAENGEILTDLHPSELKVGDCIVVRVGEKIPTDGVVLQGKSYLDMRSINGESVPISVESGQNVIAGAINTSAVLEVRVERVFEDSHIAKIAKLTQEASANKAKTQKAITSFARIYTPIIFVLALLIAFVPPLVLGGWQDFDLWREWIYRALVVLMISCPCALVIAVPLGYFASIGYASRLGVLFKGSIHLESLSQVKNIIFDKTGTLTLGNFEVLEIVPSGEFDKDFLISLAVCVESQSTHPIAQSIVKLAPSQNNAWRIESYEELSGRGVVVRCEKGEILAGNERLMKEKGIQFTPQDIELTMVYIAYNGVYAGYVSVGDRLKNDSVESIQALRRYGVEHFAILSGDNQTQVDRVAKELGITHAYGNLLPQEKAQKLVELMGRWSGKTAFVGDGINDSIVLRRSDVGVSINTGEGGNDISKESADIILQQNSLQSLVSALKIAQHTRKITWQNISFALVSKLFLIVLGVMGVANMWLAVFGDVGVALLALLNAKRPIER
ncbi:cadmium, zinc and cobalt-transporting ATPase [Helicobacter cinaedi]|uniref:heavy metal translocating P-type ATPase n=1 Tax=Helicobacter cinaedi TaxID=213 RepID=UPI001EED654E|nr:heavy metal translocating P-type ATPase [Helicobacter cinaedi]BDB66221.1 cadmium, zinc and cobalt-transporting ATPase [Helicobacter cinaedi]